MNILMLLFDRFPPDMRVEKEAESLIKAGHKIFLIARDEKEHVKVIDNITVIYLKNSMFDEFFFRFNFLKPFLAIKTKNIIKKYDINAIHVHDLPLVKTGVYCAKNFKIPIIADYHENFPANRNVQQLLRLKLGEKVEKLSIGEKIDLFILNYKRYKKYEYKMSSIADEMIVVTHEAINRFKGKINTEKIRVVGNTVNIDKIKNIEIDKEIINKYSKKFTICYIGGIGLHRGIDTSIKAMSFLKNEKIRLLIVGHGKVVPQMKKLAEELNVAENVEFVDWVDFEKVPSYIKASDVCLVPHNNFEHTQTTIPHKLFQYMYLKKSVLVSDCKPLKRVVNETGSGLVFHTNDPEDMADKIKKMSKSKKLKEYGENGYEGVLKKYNWEIDAERLVDLYQNLEKKV